MIDFSLTDEQKALRELAHDFAEKEIRPVAWEYDRDSTWPQAIIEKAWEVGLMNPQIPAEYGGAGASSIDGVLIEEELGWGCSGIGTSISCNGLASAPVLLGGSEQVKKTYLGMLTEAPKLASFCLTEPGAGSDVSGMRTRAVKREAQQRAPDRDGSPSGPERCDHPHSHNPTEVVEDVLRALDASREAARAAFRRGVPASDRRAASPSQPPGTGGRARAGRGAERPRAD